MATAITRAADPPPAATIGTRSPTYDRKRGAQTLATSMAAGPGHARRSFGIRRPLRCLTKPAGAARRAPSPSGATEATKPCPPGGHAPTAGASSPSPVAGHPIAAGSRAPAGTAKGSKGAAARKGPREVRPGATPRRSRARDDRTRTVSTASGKGAVAIGVIVAEGTAPGGLFYEVASAPTTTGT